MVGPVCAYSGLVGTDRTGSDRFSGSGARARAIVCNGKMRPHPSETCSILIEMVLPLPEEPEASIDAGLFAVGHSIGPEAAFHE